MPTLRRTLGNAVAVALASAAAALPAFPGAEGFGTETPGGRGGRVIAVSNLNDSGPGSLREAVETPGPRIIVFRTGGTIYLKSALRITEPYVTIAGQTAPGDGVCIAGYVLAVQTHDAIIRFIRVRPGDISGGEPDGIGIRGVPAGSTHNVVIDHCSVSWAIDENIGIWTKPHDFTISWCMITEALHMSTHHKGGHSCGMLVGDYTRNTSIHHNLFAHNMYRNPRIKGGGVHDIRNNLVYDWGTQSMNPSMYADMNFVGNVYIVGPSLQDAEWRYAVVGLHNIGRLYVEDNLSPHRPTGKEPEWACVQADELMYRWHEPHPAPPVTTIPAGQIYEAVLAGAGCTVPGRDSVDERIATEVRGRCGRIIDTQVHVGGWPELSAGTPPPDGDNDGMPDEWERQRGLDPTQAGDSSADRDGDGYTNIEEYINGLVPDAGAAGGH